MSRRAPSAALMPLADAVRLLTARIRSVAGRPMPLAAALGRIAAADIAAPADLPGEAIAARDGWAVAAADAAGASPFTPVLFSEAPVWIEAGEPLPDGADTILPPEALEIGPASVEVLMDAPAGEGVRFAAADLRAGDLLLRQGERLGPRHALVLAAAGVREIAVRAPRVRIVATGGVGGGAMSDALTPGLAALAAARGCDLADHVAVDDDTGAIAAALQASDADAIFVIGGTGFGHTDRTAAGLADAGKLHAHGLALRPGDTTGVGEAAGRPVVLLPGRVEAGLAAFLVLGLPLLDALCGATPAATGPQAALVRKVASAIGLAEVIFLRRVEGGVEPLGGADIPLHLLAAADHWMLVPPQREGYAAGAMVDINPL